MRTGLPQRSARRPNQRSAPLPRSGHYTLPFSFVPATAYGCFSQFCATIKHKKQETGRGLNTIEDFFAIAKKAAEIAHRDGGWDKNPVDMGWCTVGVRAPAPPPLANRCVRQRIHMRGRVRRRDRRALCAAPHRASWMRWMRMAGPAPRRRRPSSGWASSPRPSRPIRTTVRSPAAPQRQPPHPPAAPHR